MDAAIEQFMDVVRTFKVAASVEPQALQRAIGQGMKLLMLLKDELENASSLTNMRAAATDVRRDVDLVRGGVLTLLLKYREVSEASIAELQAQHAELVAAKDVTSQQHQQWNQHIATMIQDLAALLKSVNEAIGKVADNERDLDEYANLQARLNEMNALLEKHEERISILEGRLNSYQERNAAVAAAAAQRNANASRPRNANASRPRNGGPQNTSNSRYADLARALTAAQALGRPYKWDAIQSVVDGSIKDDAARSQVLRDEVAKLQTAMNKTPETRASYGKVVSELERLLPANGAPHPAVAFQAPPTTPALPQYRSLAVALAAALAADQVAGTAYEWEPIESVVSGRIKDGKYVLQREAQKLQAATTAEPNLADGYGKVISEIEKLLPKAGVPRAQAQIDLLNQVMPPRSKIAADDTRRSSQLKLAIDTLNESLGIQPTVVGGGGAPKNAADAAVTKHDLKLRLRILNKTYRVLMSIPAILKLRALSPTQISESKFDKGYNSEAPEMIDHFVRILFCSIDTNLQRLAKIDDDDDRASDKAVAALRASLNLGNASESANVWVRRSAIHDGLMTVLNGTGPLSPTDTNIIIEYIVEYTADCDGLLKVVSELNTLSSVLDPPPPRVLTYVRLRSDDPHKFNQRFRVHISSDRTMLQIAHYPTRFAMYSRDRKELLPSDPVIKASIDSHNTFWKSENPNMLIAPDSTQPKEPFTYKYGPLTRVFAPIENNTDIAKECKEVTALLRANKSVFMIGYGASGAGKTSALVYLKTDAMVSGEDGVLVKLFDTLQDPFDRLSVVVYEYKSVGKAGDGVQFPQSRYDAHPEQEDENSESDKPEFFVANGKQYVQAPDKRYPGRTREALGSYMSRKINGDARLVRPTPNNPKSSRSHVLAVVQLYKGQDAGPSLYLADLAGIESRFLCRDMDELHRFGRILGPKDVAANADLHYDSEKNVKDIDAVYASIALGVGGAPPGRGSSVRAAPKTIPVTQSKTTALVDEEPSDTTYNLVPLQALGDQPSPSDMEWMTKTLCDKVDAQIDYLKQGSHIAPDVARNFLKIYFENVQLTKQNQPPRYRNDTIAFAKFFNVFDGANQETAAGYKKANAYLSDDSTSSELAKLMTKVGQSIVGNTKLVLPELSDQSKSKLTTDKNNKTRSHLLKLAQTPLMFLEYNETATNGIFVRVPFAYKDVISKLKAGISWNEHMFGAYYEMRREQFRQRSARIEDVAKSCRLRAFEGAFINRSLQALTQRLLIGELVKAVAAEPGDAAIDMIPTFSEGCLAQQCNPWLGNCFGSQAAVKKGSASDYQFLKDIKKLILKEGQPRPTVAVFCVANLDQAANNPPSAAYIDTTDLKLEHDRIKNLDEITDIMKIYGEAGELPKDANFGVSTEPIVNLDVVKAVLSWSEYYKDLLGSTVIAQIDKLCNQINATVRKVLQNKEHHAQIHPLHELIELLETMNATHMLGTLAFTDDMAKFGSGTNTCSWSENNTLTKHLIQEDAGYKMRALIDITDG